MQIVGMMLVIMSICVKHADNRNMIGPLVLTYCGVGVVSSAYGLYFVDVVVSSKFIVTTRTSRRKAALSTILPRTVTEQDEKTCVLCSHINRHTRLWTPT